MTDPPSELIDYFMQMLVAIPAGLMAAILFALFFSHRVERTREFLRKRKKGWTRRLYVRAFIGAARGRAVATDTSMLAFLYIAFFGILGIGFQAVSVVIEEKVSRLERLYFEVQEEVIQEKVLTPKELAAELGAFLEKRERLTEELDVEVQEEVVQEKTVSHQDLEAELAALLKEKERLIKEFRRLDKEGRYLYWSSRIMGYLLQFFSMASILFLFPFVVMRRAFAHELDRFALRIQGLAGKAELAQIAVAESRVRDEPSLKTFVELVKRVAERNEVPQIVKTFDLWDDAIDQT